MGIQFVGMLGIDVRAGNSLKARMSVLHFMARAWLRKQNFKSRVILKF